MFNKITITKQAGDIKTTVSVNCSGIRFTEEMLDIVHALEQSPDKYPEIVNRMIEARNKIQSTQ